MAYKLQETKAKVPCRFHQAGRCSRDECPYAHTEQDQAAHQTSIYRGLFSPRIQSAADTSGSAQVKSFGNDVERSAGGTKPLVATSFGNDVEKIDKTTAESPPRVTSYQQLFGDTSRPSLSSSPLSRAPKPAEAFVQTYKGQVTSWICYSRYCTSKANSMALDPSCNHCPTCGVRKPPAPPSD